MLVAAFLAALSIQISGIDHWPEVFQPSFVAGVLGQIAVFVRAMYTPKPESKE